MGGIMPGRAATPAVAGIEYFWLNDEFESLDVLEGHIQLVSAATLMRFIATIWPLLNLIPVVVVVMIELRTAVIIGQAKRLDSLLTVRAANVSYNIQNRRQMKPIIILLRLLIQ